MISLITWQHLNVYSYKLKNNVCVISIFHLYEAKKQNKKKWLVKSYCGRWSKKLTSGPGHHTWLYVTSLSLSILLFEFTSELCVYILVVNI